jgi:hypothetical protein
MLTYTVRGRGTVKKDAETHCPSLRGGPLASHSDSWYQNDRSLVLFYFLVDVLVYVGFPSVVDSLVLSLYVVICVGKDIAKQLSTLCWIMTTISHSHKEEEYDSWINYVATRSAPGSDYPAFSLPSYLVCKCGIRNVMIRGTLRMRQQCCIFIKRQERVCKALSYALQKIQK